MPINKLTRFLDDNNVEYVTIRHSPAYTAQKIAAAAHIPGREIAKTVMVNMDGKMAMAVLRATDQVDLDLLRGAANAKSVTLATEDDFKDAFQGVELGAMPPFGNLYGMEVFADEALTKDAQIAFNAGSHTELLQLDYADFERLAKPKVANFSR
ncbi:MAG TPA: YbaK/EbsC family protein [Gammaproteobacteria bacterium]|nr:YbaK/EbsC family protein [Gammaproteobacteria bacterium]